MRVLVACEYSGRVRDAFLALGHDALSCDLLPTDVPGPHYEGDVFDVIDQGWDLMIAHPPCTYLSVSGLHWNKRGVMIEGRPRAEHTENALAFVRALLGANIPHIALENPISCISSRIRKPDQIVQPWQFGHDASKSTCLWLKALPKLTPTTIIAPGFACKCGHRFGADLGAYGCPNCCGDHGAAKSVYANQTPSGQNSLGPSADRWKIRSTTFKGIAEAMATQWSAHIEKENALAQRPSCDLSRTKPSPSGTPTATDGWRGQKRVPDVDIFS